MKEQLQTLHSILKIGRRIDMKTPSKTLILSILFTILTLSSFIALYATHQTPTEETTTKTLTTLTTIADYNYTAKLKPNTIYDNKTTLTENEGTLYYRITDHINITLTLITHITHAIPTTQPTNTTITYTITQKLTSNAWTYATTIETETTLNYQGTPPPIKINLPTITLAAIEQQKRKLDEDIGISTTSYNITITPTINTQTQTQHGTINQQFTPTLTLNVKRGTTQGDIITTTKLTQTKADKITEIQTITNQDIITQRNTAYALTILAIIGLAFSIYIYQKSTKQPPTLEKQLQKLIHPHKDLIIQVTQEPQTQTQTTTITLNSLENLKKVAEITLHPILHCQNPNQPNTHTFTIIDNQTIYKYTHTLENIIQKTPKKQAKTKQE
jgi:hypothetical protein